MLKASPGKYFRKYFLALPLLFTVLFMLLACFAGAQDTIHFSDHIWNIRNSTTEIIGPGNNYWSADKTKSVWVDGNGFLHLKLTSDENNRDKRYCAQVETQDTMGKGTHQFEVEGLLTR